MQKKLGVITKYRHIAAIIKMFIFVKAPRTDAERSGNKLT
jgi:hypothetical protein